MLETVINIIEWPSLQYCTMSAFRGDALQRKAMSHKSSFIIIDESRISPHLISVCVCQCAEVANVHKELEKMKEAVSSAEYRIKWFQNKLKDELEAHKVHH